MTIQFKVVITLQKGSQEEGISHGYNNINKIINT